MQLYRMATGPVAQLDYADKVLIQNQKSVFGPYPSDYFLNIYDYAF